MDVNERNRRLNKLHVDSRALLEQVSDRLPPKDLLIARELSDVGEWAELLDVFCASLVKNSIAVTVAERDRLAELMGRFNQPLEGYAFLGDPKGVLAQIVVTPTQG